MVFFVWNDGILKVWRSWGCFSGRECRWFWRFWEVNERFEVEIENGTKKVEEIGKKLAKIGPGGSKTSLDLKRPENDLWAVERCLKSVKRGTLYLKRWKVIYREILSGLKIFKEVYGDI